MSLAIKSCFLGYFKNDLNCLLRKLFLNCILNLRFTKTYLFFVLFVSSFLNIKAQDTLRNQINKNKIGVNIGIGISPKYLSYASLTMPMFSAGIAYERMFKKSFFLEINITGILTMTSYSDTYSYSSSDTTSTSTSIKTKDENYYLTTEFKMKKSFKFFNNQNNSFYFAAGILIVPYFRRDYFYDNHSDRFVVKKINNNTTSVSYLDSFKSSSQTLYDRFGILNVSPIIEVGLMQKIKKIRLCYSFKMLPFFYTYSTSSYIPNNLETIQVSVYY